MRETTNRFGFCLHGEHTGDDTPLYDDDDDRERTTCPVCGHTRLDGWCAECNGRRIEAIQAARTALRAAILPPPPLRHAA